MEHLIELNSVYKIYQMGSETVHALDGIDLTIDRGEFVEITSGLSEGDTVLVPLQPQGGATVPAGG